MLPSQEKPLSWRWPSFYTPLYTNFFFLHRSLNWEPQGYVQGGLVWKNELEETDLWAWVQIIHPLSVPPVSLSQRPDQLSACEYTEWWPRALSWKALLLVSCWWSFRRVSSLWGSKQTLILPSAPQYQHNSSSVPPASWYLVKATVSLLL